jgi:hypothetical protein
MTHPLAAYFGMGYLDTAAVTYNTAETNALILAACALEVLDRAEDSLAKESVALRLERPVINCLRLGNLPE